MPNTEPQKQDDRLLTNSKKPKPDNDSDKNPEIGGPKGPEPTRFGDWEKNGRCIDF